MIAFNLRSAEHAFTTGHDYSIADIAHFGWILRHEFPGIDLAETPRLTR